MKHAIRKLGIAVAALAAVGCPRPTSVGRTVVLISLDTTRPDHMSVYGYPRRTTPRLGEMAADGIVFDEAITVHTNTCPSHASMLSGLYPPSHGSLNNGVPIAEGFLTMPEIFAREGFATAAFVSGITLKAENCGLERGFGVYDDDFAGFARGARKTLGRARDWLSTVDPQTDIFVFFHLYDPHFEYNPPKEFLRFGSSSPPEEERPLKLDELRTRMLIDPRSAEVQRSLHEWIRRYDGEIAYADWAVGELLDTLRAMGRYDGGLIVMVSDHGETLDERPWVFDHGSRVTEEQIRIPMILKLPDRALAGTRVEQPVSQVDILPTVLAQLGIAPPTEPVGWDLRGLVGDTDIPDRTTFVLARRVPKRMTDLGFDIPPPASPGRPGSQVLCARRPPYKLVDFGFMNPKKLLVGYDLSRDPEEKHGEIIPPDRLPPPFEALDQEMTAWWDRTWRPEAAPKTDIPEDRKEKLRALGYVD